MSAWSTPIDRWVQIWFNWSSYKSKTRHQNITKAQALQLWTKMVNSWANKAETPGLLSLPLSNIRSRKTNIVMSGLWIFSLCYFVKRSLHNSSEFQIITLSWYHSFSLSKIITFIVIISKHFFKLISLVFFYCFAPFLFCDHLILLVFLQCQDLIKLSWYTFLKNRKYFTALQQFAKVYLANHVFYQLLKRHAK